MRDLKESTAELNRILAALMPQQARTKFWKNRATGVEYHYTTEPTRGAKHNAIGHYVCVYKPVGKGARGKHPTRWKMIDERGPYDRLIARRLAYQMYLESKQKFLPVARNRKRERNEIHLHGLCNA